MLRNAREIKDTGNKGKLSYYIFYCTYIVSIKETY